MGLGGACEIKKPYPPNPGPVNLCNGFSLACIIENMQGKTLERRCHCTWCHIRLVHCPQAHSLSEPKQPAHAAILLRRAYWTHHSDFLVQPQLCLYYQWQSLRLVFWTSNSLASSHHGYATRGSVSPLPLRHFHCKMPGTTNLSALADKESRSQDDLLLFFV